MTSKRMTIDQYRQMMTRRFKVLEAPTGSDAWTMVESFILRSDLTGLLDFLVFIMEAVDNRLQYSHLKVQDDLAPMVQVTGFTEPSKLTPDPFAPFNKEFHIGILPETIQKGLRNLTRYRESSAVELINKEGDVSVSFTKKSGEKTIALKGQRSKLASPADLADGRVVETKQHILKAWPPNKDEVFLLESEDIEYPDGQYGPDNILAGLPESTTVQLIEVDTPHEVLRLIRDLIDPVHEAARQLDGIIRVTDTEKPSVLRSRLKNKARALTGKRRTDECNPSHPNNEVNAARRILRSNRSRTPTKRRVG